MYTNKLLLYVPIYINIYIHNHISYYSTTTIILYYTCLVAPVVGSGWRLGEVRV